MIKWLALDNAVLTSLKKMWSVVVLRKVIQSNARFGLSDRLEVYLDHVRISSGNCAVKTKGISLDVMNAIKKSVVFGKAALYCMAMH